MESPNLFSLWLDIIIHLVPRICLVLVIILVCIRFQWLRRAQVEPHFLNNTLNAIRTLIKDDPEKAQGYVGALAGFFAETCRQCASTDTTVTLQAELAQLRRYLEFQDLRFPPFQDFFRELPETRNGIISHPFYFKTVIFKRS